MIPFALFVWRVGEVSTRLSLVVSVLSDTVGVTMGVLGGHPLTVLLLSVSIQL